MSRQLYLRRQFVAALGVLAVAGATVAFGGTAEPTAATVTPDTALLCQAAQRGQLSSADVTWARRCERVLAEGARVLAAEASPAPSPTGTPEPTPAPSPTVTPEPSPTEPVPGQCVPAPRYPTAACTGVPEGWVPQQTITGDLRVTAAGAVLDGLRVTGSVQVQAHDVRIVNSEIYGQVKNQYSGHIYDRLRVEHSTIGPPSGVASFTGGLIEGTGYTAIGNRLRSNTEGFRNGGFSYGGGLAGPVVLIGNYVRLAEVAGLCAHTDGLQGYDESDHAVVRNNTFDLRGVSCTTAAVYIGSPYGADEVTDNLLLGGDSYVMRLEGASTHFDVVSGNRLVRGAWSNPLARVASCSTVGIWRDNRSATITADGTVVDGPLLTNCPEDVASLGHALP